MTLRDAPLFCQHLTYHVPAAVAFMIATQENDVSKPVTGTTRARAEVVIALLPVAVDVINMDRAPVAFAAKEQYAATI